MEYLSHNVADTFALGQRLGQLVLPGEIIALDGELGSGKTILAKGVAEGLGLDPLLITSPTFTLIAEYNTGRIPLFHMDFYRLRGENEVQELGLEEYFQRSGLVIIEWAQRARLPDRALQLRFEYTREEDQRRIICQTPRYRPAVLSLFHPSGKYLG